MRVCFPSLSFTRTYKHKHGQCSTCENKAGGDPSQSQPKHRQEEREHLGKEEGGAKWRMGKKTRGGEEEEERRGGMGGK